MLSCFGRVLNRFARSDNPRSSHFLATSNWGGIRRSPPGLVIRILDGPLISARIDDSLSTSDTSYFQTSIHRSFMSTSAKVRATLRLGIMVFSCLCASDCKSYLEYSPAKLNMMDSQPALMRPSEHMLEWLWFNLFPTSAGTKLMGSRFGGSSATWQPQGYLVTVDITLTVLSESPSKASV